MNKEGMKKNIKWWKKPDVWLRKNAPAVWRTKIHYILPIAILLYPILYCSGYLYSTTCNDNDHLIVDPIAPIRLWEESYFYISLLAAFIFYFYWFSLQSRKADVPWNLKRVLASFLVYFIGVSFLFIFCTNAFRLGTIYEHKVNKMTEEDISIVKDNNYFLFGTNRFSSEYDDELFYSTFLIEEEILKFRYDSTYLNRYQESSHRSIRQSISLDRLHLIGWSSSPYPRWDEFRTREGGNLLSQVQALNNVYSSYRAAPFIVSHDETHLSGIYDLFDLNVISLGRYESSLSKLMNSTRFLDVDEFKSTFLNIKNGFEIDRKILLDSLMEIESSLISNQAKKSIKKRLTGISRQIDAYIIHGKYINDYSENVLNGFPDLNFCQRNHLTLTIGLFGIKNRRLYYYPPPKILQLENRTRSVNHANLFLKEKIHWKFYLKFFPYAILLSLGLLLAPFFQLEFSFKSLIGIVSLLFILFIFIEKIPESNFIKEGSPKTWIYLLSLGTGNLILLAALLLKKNNSYIQFCFHLMIALNIAILIFSLYHFGYTLQTGIQDFRDLNETINKAQTNIERTQLTNILLFVPSKIQFWLTVALAGITGILAPLVFSQPKSK